MNVGDKVKPRKDVLTHSGTVWESHFVDLGWNEIPDDAQFGVVVKVHPNGFPDVLFEGIHHTEVAMFPSEIMEVA